MTSGLVLLLEADRCCCREAAVGFAARYMDSNSATLKSEREEREGEGGREEGERERCDHQT